ncbi:MAG: PAS domain S-box protein [Cytophagales bacterium]|nr:PAS domain S-box protein [Cytophagales bacterium]
MQIKIQDNSIDFNEFFPFFFVLDENLNINEVGKSLLKVFPAMKGQSFNQVFKFKRPWSIKYTYESIVEYSKQLFILEGVERKALFRWQVRPLENSKQILFIGTPWIISSDELQNYGLTLNDFALHDTLPDIFQMLKSNDINNQDVKVLAEELKEQKELLQEVVDLIPHQIFLKDLNSRFILVNKKVEEIFGSTSEKIVGKTYDEFHKIPTKEGSYDLTDRMVMETGNKVELIHEPQIPIHGKKVINHILKLPFEIRGELKGVLGIAIDITEQIESEQKLKESEDRYRLLIENALDVIYQITFDGRFTFLNSLAETISEYSMEELLQMRYIDLIRDDYKEKTTDYYLSEAYLSNTQNSYFEFPIITKSGKEVWIGQKVQPLVKDGTLVGYQAVARDITQIKKLELERLEVEEEVKETAIRLKSLIENLNAGILVEDENRKIVAVNEVFCEMFGISVPPSEMIGWDCSGAAEQSKALFQDPEKFIVKINKILEERMLVTDEELTMKEGRILERDYIPIFVKNDYRGHLWSYKDITSRKVEEMELVKAKKQAEASSIAKEQFLSTMSHEIRTPMNAVIGMTQLLMNKEPKEEQIEYLNAIKYSADNLLGLINNILDFSKIESGKVSLESTEFDIYDLVQKIHNIFRYQADEKGLMFTMHLEKNVERYLKGDTIRLNQILTNLVGNALKFTESGQVSILIKQSGSVGEKLNIVFEVADTGIGIPAEKVDSIFERFTQANSDTTRKYGGTGLGLTITKLLVELLGGTIRVKSQVHEGTTFIVEIPFLPAQKDKVITTKLKAKEMEGQLSGKKVLLVEDNNLNQLIASEFMKNWGLEVVLAENGLEALDQLRKDDQIDLVLMDLQMPQMDGYTATQKIRSDFDGKFDSLPIIALSASTSSEVREKVMSVGMNDYLSKPFESQALFKKINDYIHLTASTKTAKPLAETKVKPNPNPSFNLSYYEEFSGGNKEFIKEMIKVFLNETPSILLKLNDYVNENNHSGISATCHKLKTSFMMMGIDSSSCKQLEEMAKSGVKDFFTIKKLNNKIQELGYAGIAGLKSVLENY